MGYIKEEQLTKHILLAGKVKPTEGYFTWLSSIICIPGLCIVSLLKHNVVQMDVLVG